MGGGEWTDNVFRGKTGDSGESGAKLEDDEGGRDCSIFGERSSAIESDKFVDALLSRSDDDDELFRVWVLRCRVIISRRQAEYGH